MMRIRMQVREIKKLQQKKMIVILKTFKVNLDLFYGVYFILLINLFVSFPTRANSSQSEIL